MKSVGCVAEVVALPTEVVMLPMLVAPPKGGVVVKPPVVDTADVGRVSELIAPSQWSRARNRR